jgi:hypothetical protein
MAPFRCGGRRKARAPAPLCSQPCVAGCASPPMSARSSSSLATSAHPEHRGQLERGGTDPLPGRCVRLTNRMNAGLRSDAHEVIE